MKCAELIRKLQTENKTLLVRLAEADRMVEKLRVELKDAYLEGFDDRQDGIEISPDEYWDDSATKSLIAPPKIAAAKEGE